MTSALLVAPRRTIRRSKGSREDARCGSNPSVSPQAGASLQLIRIALVPCTALGRGVNGARERRGLQRGQPEQRPSELGPNFRGACFGSRVARAGFSRLVARRKELAPPGKTFSARKL